MRTAPGLSPPLGRLLLAYPPVTGLLFLTLLVCFWAIPVAIACLSLASPNHLRLVASIGHPHDCSPFPFEFHYPDHQVAIHS